MEQISFGTDGWRATLETFTAPRVRMVGQAVATYLRAEGETAPVAIGYDARETSRGFAEELSRVLCANGFDVVLSARDCPTPVVAHAIVERELAGALVVTASHNPPEYNGVKFIPGDGAPALPAVMDAIGDRLAEPEALPESEHGTVEEVDLRGSHAAAARDRLDAIAPGTVDSIAGLTVAYDAMHGSGRGYADRLLSEAGASVERLRCERDPDFGGTPPEPATANLQDLIEHVQRGDADLGIANDGDADRIAVVTPERGLVDENLFFAALYDWLLTFDSGPAVRTVSTTYLIDRVAAAHDETVHEVPVGFKWVAQAMADHDALVGGEESGGFTVRGHVREKDGVFVALLAAAMHADEPIDARVDRLLADYGAVVQDKRSVDCPDAEKARVIEALAYEIPQSVAGEPVEDVNTADGFKLQLADGSWLLVRPSGTEPVLRVYAEASDDERVDALLTEGTDLVARLV
ncbi:phosphoglucomutase/phosphomannomutase alpha/beta/alpha domain I [Halovivax asiaticus JCM 14624]|uniref:Phosphoglucomutase/phosphomannomutase alpha/beta/alpha domain I n=1 Tax=Halovivax asiaticus JCM 14624 TaxID=1227490 RepID=M0BKN1_9EURY|nr:phosphoglucomutase/phosphomannomutase family protein [Halovivax asiaticus]ELZ11007.1 phosphoglucomutase/phosphomannomutase alpha/beta/alpha domain I [Halovivax asiaticus JCM 14624]